MPEQPETCPASAAAPPDFPAPSPSRPADAPLDPRIADYLDHVCAPLVGAVPYDRRQDLRDELRSHLMALVASYMEIGEGPEDAVLSTLRQFGEPRALGERWAREWSRNADAPRPHSLWQATGTGLAYFIVADLIAIGQYPGLHLLDFATSSAMPLQPLMELLLLLGIAVGLPIGAGLLTGKTANDRAVPGAFIALCGCTALSGLLALSAPKFAAVLPSFPEFARALAAGQAMFWIPLGCGATAFSQWLRGRRESRPRRWLPQ